MTQIPMRQPAGREAPAPRLHLAPDAYVLTNRSLRPDARLSESSRFADDTWDLGPAVHEGHERGPVLHWRRIHPTFRRAFKEYVYVLLNEENPPGLTRGSVHRLAPKTIYSDMIGLAAFAEWLADRGFENLSQVTEPHLDRWLAHVTALPAEDASLRVKRPMLLCVQRLAIHRDLLRESDRLPVRLVWDGESVDALLNAPKRDRSGNLTPRINEPTMNAILQWSLLITEQVGPQVAALLREQRENPTADSQVRAPVTGPRWQTRTTSDEARSRLRTYIETLAADGGALPGKADGTIHWSEVSIAAGLRPATLYKGEHLREAVLEADLPIAVPNHGTVRIDLPTGSVTIALAHRQDLATWNRLVHAAAFVVIAYLSGMRPGEVLNLKRDCVERDTRLGLIKVWGRAWKGVTEGGAKVAEGQERPVPWIVTDSVADTIALLESLTPHDFLFPTTYNNNSQRKAEHNSRLGAAMNDDIRDFIDWVNDTFSGPNQPAIPTDDHPIHAARFRRTLAWFVVRRPRGLVAAAVQYGHLFTNITMGYAGYADAGWLDDLALERLFAAVDQAREDERLLSEGEQVSGVAAAQYVTRVRGAARTFEGRTITAVRQARQLLEREDLQVFHGEGMTCVFNLLTAACAPNQHDARPTPDLPGCVSTCRNLAHTDRDIDDKRRERAQNEQEIADGLTPEPLRERLRARNHHLTETIDAHASAVGAEE